MMLRERTFRPHARYAVIVCALTASIGHDPSPASAQRAGSWQAAASQMVEREIAGAGVENERVLEAMRNTPRHEFVGSAQRQNAYLDMALPIGSRQTISPPFVVAYMTQELDPRPDDRVLEIGTGSGYQAAVLSPLVRDVYTIEIVETLGRRAARTLRRLRYGNVHAKVGDGFAGWPEHAPFDKIIVTCSPEAIPQPLIDQLAEGGRIVIPLGERYQQTLYVYNKRDGELEIEALRPTLFVPMTGKAEESRELKPDPLRPGIANGGFEQSDGEPPAPLGWHYQRQLEWITGEDAAEGESFVRFRNQQPGRGSRALQGFAVDGRYVTELAASFWIRGAGIRPGQNADQLPMFIVTFYDDRRATAGHVVVGPWRGTFDWRRERHRLRVPNAAREAIVRIGLLGGVGELDVDGIELSGVGTQTTR